MYKQTLSFIPNCFPICFETRTEKAELNEILKKQQNRMKMNFNNNKKSKIPYVICKVSKMPSNDVPKLLPSKILLFFVIEVLFPTMVFHIYGQLKNQSK